MSERYVKLAYVKQDVCRAIYFCHDRPYLLGMKQLGSTVLAVAMVFGGMGARVVMRAGIHTAFSPAHAAATAHRVEVKPEPYVRVQQSRFAEFPLEGLTCWVNSADEVLCKDSSGAARTVPHGLGPTLRIGDTAGCAPHCGSGLR